jgi:hypothetical protein
VMPGDRLLRFLQRFEKIWSFDVDILVYFSINNYH